MVIKCPGWLDLSSIRPKMDFEKTKYTQTIVAVSEREIIINSERFIGFSYIFRKKNASTYECESCKTLGKYRGVTVRNGRLSVLKHPEDDHHKDCRPRANSELISLSLIRDPASKHSAHDASVDQRRVLYSDHSKHDPYGSPKNSVEESNYS